MTLFIIILIVLVVVLAGYGILTYNKLVQLRVSTEESLSDIDVQLKRRHDLIPNLVETVKGYAKHESGVFEEVTKARAAATATSATDNIQKATAAENQLTSALMNLQATAENYPDLKASTNFIQLQNELSATEDKIAAARRYYNTSARTLNTKIQQFPSSVIAKMKNFVEFDFFELEDEAERETPSVSF
jgi:LemA protein